MEAVSAGRRVTVAGRPVRLAQHRVVLLDPRAAERSWGEIFEQLERRREDLNLEFVLATPDHRLLRVDSESVDILADFSSFQQWLDAGTPGAVDVW